MSHHGEQDHSGSIPKVLGLYPEATVLCSPKAKPLLLEHLDVPAERIQIVADGETLSLGDKTLRFVHTPWVHWPETMATYLPEDRILFRATFWVAPGDFEPVREPRAHVLAGAKRYYAEIMMPFRKVIVRNMDKIQPLEIDLIAPSHGPIYDQPAQILSAYQDWVSDRVANQVVIPYVSMHGSTEAMVDYLATSLVERGVEVKLFELSATDLGELAMALVDPATLVIGTPTVLGGPHPTVFAVTHLANALRPKLRYASIIGSFGWGPRQWSRSRPNPKPRGGSAGPCAEQRHARKGDLLGTRRPGRYDPGEARSPLAAGGRHHRGGSVTVHREGFPFLSPRCTMGTDAIRDRRSRPWPDSYPSRFASSPSSRSVRPRGRSAPGSWPRLATTPSSSVPRTSTSTY